MVNRTLQQKVFKMRRRGKSRPWSQNRLKAAKPTKAEVVDFLNLQHRHVRPATSSHTISPTLYTMAQAKGQDPMPRPKALVSGYNLLKMMQKYQDLPDLSFNVTLHEDRFHKIVMLTNRQCSAYVVLAIDFETHFAKASIKYPSRDNLFDALERHTIRWLHFENLSKAPPDDAELIEQS